jgi:hypothetical protein
LTDNNAAPTDEDIHKYRVHWQRKRLRRFGKSQPAELASLSTRLEADTSVPQPTGVELRLHDTGRSGGSGWSGEPKSPLSEEELRALSPESLGAYLRDYKPARETYDAPTPAGLAAAIANRIRDDPSVGVRLLKTVPVSGMDPTYVRGTLQGLVGAVESGRDIAWPDVLPLLEQTARQSNESEAAATSDFNYADANWRWAQREAAKLISAGASKNAVSVADTDALWHAVETLLASDATWDETFEMPKTMSSALSVALNSMAGDAVQALLDVALWNFRQMRSGAEMTGTITAAAGIDPIAFPAGRLRAGIEVVLGTSGSSAHAARVRLGQYLPQLLLMDREWILERAPQLFAGGFEPPLSNPVWAGYITTQRFYNNVFSDLKAWYVQAATALPPLVGAAPLGDEQDSTWSTTRHLTLHCLLAALRDLHSPQATDGLISLAFERSTIADRSHAYWEVFHSWNAPEGGLPNSMVDLLLDFWAWRLDVIATRAVEERTGEAGALGWLVPLTSLPESRLLPLLSRTAEYANGEFPMEHAMWERLLSLADLEVGATMDIVGMILRAELRGKYPHFNISEVGPVLRTALHSDDPDARQKCRDLINLLGDSGFVEFGTLL